MYTIMYILFYLLNIIIEFIYFDYDNFNVIQHWYYDKCIR